MGTTSVNERIVRRQLTFRRGQLFEQRKLQESQRRLYAMELFNFVNIETVKTPGAAPAGQTRRAKPMRSVPGHRHRR